MECLAVFVQGECVRLVADATSGGSEVRFGVISACI